MNVSSSCAFELLKPEMHRAFKTWNALPTYCWKICEYAFYGWLLMSLQVKLLLNTHIGFQIEAFSNKWIFIKIPRECELGDYLFARGLNVPADVDEQRFNSITRDSITSIRQISKQIAAPWMKIWRVLKREILL